MRLHYYGAGCLILMIVADLIRLLPGMGLVVSLLPMAVALVGVAIVITDNRSARLPKGCRLAFIGLLIMILWGVVSSIANGLPFPQIFAGLLAESGPAPGLILGFAVALDKDSWNLVKRVVPWLLLFSIGIAILQQLGFGGFTMIEGAQTDRSLSLGRSIQYSSGPFRTANVFAQFLITSGLVLVLMYSERLQKSKRGLSWKMYSHLLMVIVGTLLAARRSGLVIVLGVVIPFLFFSKERLKFSLFTVLAIVLFYLGTMGASETEQKKLSAKVNFASEVEVGTRVGAAFDVHPEDWELLSFMGDGLGSHGPSTQAAGLIAFESEQFLIERHNIMHVGWFVDLQSFGPIGAIGHLFWFMGILVAVFRVSRSTWLKHNSARWSGIGYAGLAIFNYYFVATSWLHSVTGGLLFGLGVGFFLGRMKWVAAAHKHQRSVKSSEA